MGPAQKVERLRGSLHCIGAPAQARHTVFVDGEAEAAAFRPDEYFDTPAELVSRTFNRPRRRAPRKLDTAGQCVISAIAASVLREVTYIFSWLSGPTSRALHVRN